MAYTPTPEQKAILAHRADNHARLSAGPGTGKSATLIAWLRENPKIRAKLLTFTRAATGELVQKLEENADLNLERPSTIHSFCISVLRQNPGLGDFPKPLRLADDWERNEIVEESLSKRLGLPKKTVSKLFRELAANWESLNPQETEAVTAADRARFMGGWQEHRKIYGYALLAELPFALRNALRDHDDIKGTDYNVLVVDEYQDLNSCDLEVLSLIAKRGCKVIGAGDADQSIYSFRKAHPEGIRRFLDDYDGAADYPLTITRRCPKRIVQWANYVIQGDPDRPTDAPSLTAADTAADGETALLSFRDQAAEANGVARLVASLINQRKVPAEEVLILLRSDHNAQFSRPIKEELGKLGIAYADPSETDAILEDPANRRALALMRLATDNHDSLAWATLLRLTHGLGPGFQSKVYEQAKTANTTFADALLYLCAQEFAGFSKALASHGVTFVEDVLALLSKISVPSTKPDTGWAAWLSTTAGEVGLAISDELNALLSKVDERIEPTDSLDRYLSSIAPTAKDIALEKSDKVRIMTLAASKGLTVKAAIIAGLESGVGPT